MTVKLNVTNRTEPVAKVRERGEIPGVVYGPKQQPLSIQAPAAMLEKLVHDAGESTIIELAGLEKPIQVLVHDVAYNAKRGGIEHIDFYAIERGKEVTTNVPLEFIGEAPAVKLGGSLTKVLHDVEVTCPPDKLPHHITVDVSSLVDFEAQIKIGDLEIPEGVKIDAEADEVVALVVEASEEPEVSEEFDMEAVAVEQKGKGEEVEE